MMMQTPAQELTRTAAAILFAYALGSIPFAIWLTRWSTGKDIRRTGSGHAGATNVMRAAGWGVGAVVLLLDLSKGYLAMGLVMRLVQSPLEQGLASAALVAGHCWPILAGLRGGMGLAAGGGALAAVWPLGFVLAVGLAALMQLLIRHSARGNFAGGLLLAPVWLLFGASAQALAVAAGIGIVISIRATSNWNRTYRELWFDREP